MLINTKTLKIHRTERLSWDKYFMSIALLASGRSPCTRLQVGTVIVKDNRIISMGYNGFIAGAPHISIVKDNHEQAIIHSEINAITDCAKRGVQIKDAIIYITHFPCINCCKYIISSGIQTVFYLENYKNDQVVYELFNQANIQIIQL